MPAFLWVCCCSRGLALRMQGVPPLLRSHRRPPNPQPPPQKRCNQEPLHQQQVPDLGNPPQVLRIGCKEEDDNSGAIQVRISETLNGRSSDPPVPKLGIGPERSLAPPRSGPTGEGLPGYYLGLFRGREGAGLPQDPLLQSMPCHEDEGGGFLHHSVPTGDL